MSILNEIQAAVMDPAANLSSALLKLRFLASRLGSEPLADWVKHETEGYPEGVSVPDYRIIGVTYRATFSGPLGSGIKNAPIPSYLIAKYAGENWLRHEVRGSVAAVEQLVSNTSGSLGIDASNLILLLQGNVYEELACNSVTGNISRTDMSEILQSVRSRVLELTLELEKAVPQAVEVAVASPALKNVDTKQVSKIINQTVYGNLMHVNASDNATVNFNINQGDASALIKELVNVGIPQNAAEEFAEIVASEKPQNEGQPLGTKAVEWIGKNLSKAANGTWKIGLSVFAKVLEEAAMRYYGFK
ncbi:hypothetical protein [Ferrovibrio sp.]|uniref:AbiTii domain-containing protein n=1 Tax=Ferrovibrio sp. TaxID=1917215 RepID=UPI0035AEE2EB